MPHIFTLSIQKLTKKTLQGVILNINLCSLLNCRSLHSVTNDRIKVCDVFVAKLYLTTDYISQEAEIA